MKKILGIIGSPRKLGNSELMAKEISRNIPVPHELKLLRLIDFILRACRGCYKCLFDKKRCPIKDDLYTVVDAMCAADAIILAAPVYCLGVPAALKQFIDRSLSLHAHIDRLWGIPSVGVCISFLCWN